MSSNISPYPLQPPESANGSTNGLPGQSQQHKRVYQACIPCRRRKVRCDLGSVDNPGDPPCVRCRRESKECYFSATRRKRKLDGTEGSADGYEFDDDYVSRNGRKRVHGSDDGASEPQISMRHQTSASAMLASAQSLPSYIDHSAISSPHGPLTPGGHIGRNQPLRRPQESPESSHRDDRNNDDPNIRVENPEAQDVMRREVYGPHDALDLLYKAATDSPGHKRVQSNSVQQNTPINGHRSPSTKYHVPVRQNSQSQPRQMGPPNVRKTTRFDPVHPEHNSDKVDEAIRDQQPGYKDAIKAWSRFRFVRAGWFTAAEAIDYIAYYYEFLSPLTPISPPTFQKPGTHPTLLYEEPILTVTLLTIASRYRQMPGPGGHCRSHAIHEQLWTYLRGMIERCFWGQESFGGGFCGSGATEWEQTSSTAPWRGLRKGSLRTLGTVESLMILTEWHPRALHFPPAEATDELMLPSYDGTDNISTDDDGNRKHAGGVGGKRIESWLEPAWRSDRMCWMLLSTAMGLSYELGVFDKIEELLQAGGDMARPEYEDESYRLRAARIKKLLLIYVTQLAGRLGWTNMVPEHLRKAESPELRKNKLPPDATTPSTSTISTGFTYIPDLELDDQIIHCWEGITTAMRTGNEKIFRSRKYTTEIIQSGRYIELLKEFQPMLSGWKKTCDSYRLPPYMKHILTIEYEYVRIYVNSLSLQAVVERSTNSAGNPGAGAQNTFEEMSPETQNYYGKLPLAHLGGFGPADQEYVKEVVDGSRNLLRTVVEGLLPGDYLKHAPVRTYFRIISGAMFLLKTFALGASKNDVELSIGLMDRAVAALRDCVVDDVHLGIRFADLLETLTSRLRNRFMHAAPMAPPANTSARQSPQPRQEKRPSEEPGRVENRDPRPGVYTPSSRFQESTSQADGISGVSATPFDFGQSSFYPNTPYTSNNNDYDMTDQSFSQIGGWEGVSDLWYLPPGAAFFQNSDQAITQTAEGVNVGGIDLLDYMTMDQFPGIDGALGNGNGSGF